MARSRNPAKVPEKVSLSVSKAFLRASKRRRKRRLSTRTRQEEIAPAGDPPGAVGREPATSDDAMQMRMMEERLPPSVEHGQEAELGAEMLGIGGDYAQGLGGGAEEDAVDGCLVLMVDGGDRRRQCEDNVKVGRRQKLRLAIFQPLSAGQRLAFWAMSVAARIVRDALMTACFALLDVAAERRCPATHNRSHDAALRGRQRAVVLPTIGITVAAEDLRHPEP